MADKIYDEPSTIAAEGGIVIVDGPDGVAVLFTPDAAEETGRRLLDGAAEAQGQVALKRIATRRPTDEPG